LNKKISITCAFAFLIIGGMQGADAETLQGLVTNQETQVLQEESDSLLGVWKISIPQLHRNPKVAIKSISHGQVTGTYKGLLGTFPLWGNYKIETGEIALFIDFSSAKIARFRSGNKRKAIAQMIGRVDLANQFVSGSAALPEFSNGNFQFQGKKSN